MPGISTSRAEVVQLTPAGLWLAWRDTELFLDHDCFPWFRRASVDQVFNVIDEREASSTRPCVVATARWPAG